MRICITGDGVGGRTLYHLLKKRGFDVDLYGQENRTKCGIRPCGFGTSESCIHLLKKIGISTEKRLLHPFDYISQDGRKIKGTLYGIDKPGLLESIATDIRYDKPDMDSYTLIVDATGIARAYSPPVTKHIDKKALCYQHRVISKEKIVPVFNAIRGGYLWIIPLNEREAHVGGGSTILPPGEIKQMVHRLVEDMNSDEIVCSCSEPIRLSGPIFPLVNEKVVTVGEGAGLVVPFGGAGIQTSIESIIILSNLIDKDHLRGYDKAIRRRFGWVCESKKLWDDLERGKIKYSKLGTAYYALRYQGLKPTLLDLLHIRRMLIEANS